MTFTASWQKIFSTDVNIGYWEQWRQARAKLPTLTDPAKIDEQNAVIRNAFIQGTLSIVFLVAVAFVIVCAILRVVKTLRTGETTTSEDPFQESNFFAPERLFASKLDKKLVAEYAAVGDPALIPEAKKARGVR